MSIRSDSANPGIVKRPLIIDAFQKQADQSSQQHIAIVRMPKKHPTERTTLGLYRKRPTRIYDKEPFAYIRSRLPLVGTLQSHSDELERQKLLVSDLSINCPEQGESHRTLFHLLTSRDPLPWVERRRVVVIRTSDGFHCIATVKVSYMGGLHSHRDYVHCIKDLRVE